LRLTRQPGSIFFRILCVGISDNVTNINTIMTLLHEAKLDFKVMSIMCLADIERFCI
jgi:hypothetical protein